MWGCIAVTETLRENLAARFARYPVNPWASSPELVEGPPAWWGEPGIYEGDKEYGRADLCRRGESINPCVVFVHPAAMGYQQLSRWHRRYGQPAPENRAERLEQFGTMADLRRKYWEVETA